MNTLRNIWEVANEIGLLVKLSIVIIFGLLVISLRKLENSTSIFFYFANIALAIIAVLVVITLMPSGYSRGYGIGLIGKSDMQTLPIYLCGAIFGGAAYSFVYKLLSTVKNR
jgi:Cu/Ag efflux pump CusA